ncbi:hypothetical protein BCV70DRAFT_201132 [Testicularia cyperi]|uniref:Uncharacterized protein n=1 Tax=Testicularia cyperi TaxID=1882483 RepID=A0A317XP18_9BASI|nr:hypothetical protein BCV70DRAFT_201132 [Testicularia cyperi]
MHFAAGVRACGLMLAAVVLATCAVAAPAFGPSSASSSSSNGAGPGGKVAVVFSDVKFDDKAAVWTLLKDPQYDAVVTVMQGINDQERAAKALLDFVGRMNSIPVAGARVDPSKLRLLAGSNVLGIDAPHEVWYRGGGTVDLAPMTPTELRPILAGKHVAIFQLAPTLSSDVEAVVETADKGSIDSLMLLHGYNSRQANMQAQERFLVKLRALVKSNNPSGEVYFTSSGQSYAAKNGGKHPYDWVKQRFPAPDVEQAIQDPFWARQLERSAEVLEKAGMHSFLPSDAKEISKWVYLARKDPAQYLYYREQIVKQVETTLQVIAQLPEQERAKYGALHFRLQNTLLPEFSEGTTIELADAGHVALFHRAMAGDRRIERVPVYYPSGHYEPGAAVGFKKALDPQQAHGMLLQGASTELDREWIEALFHSR